jgi:hypothetical protein
MNEVTGQQPLASVARLQCEKGPDEQTPQQTGPSPSSQRVTRPPEFGTAGPGSICCLYFTSGVDTA